MERLFGDDWTLNPSVWNYQIAFRPDEYVKGSLATSWEFTDPSTLVVQIRQGVYWQNLPPANGRELTAADVAYHYDREYCGGSGFAKGSPYLASATDYQNLVSATATGSFTVTLKWAIPNPEFILETVEAQSSGSPCIECPDAVAAYGNLNNWHNAIGTGPFILTDFVDSSEATMVKNPNYWGSDERYPQNKLPYVDSLKVLIIANNSTALSAMRTGKIDVIDTVAYTDALNMKQSNPEIQQVSYPSATALSVEMRNDKKPFSDIRVREAMQMAIDLQSLAKGYYQGTASPSPSTLTSNYFPAGWGFPYSQWPADLQAQYAYNTSGAKQLLAAAGYANGFTTDCVADGSADSNVLQIVQSEWAAIGINMSIQTMDYATWLNYVQTQHQEDAVSYRSTGLLGILYQPVRQFLPFLTGNPTNWMNISDPAYDTDYQNLMAATTNDGLKQVVQDANKEVATQHFVISLLQPSAFGLYQPWLVGYDGQYEAIGGVALGPQLLGFYGARFWINQTLKQSMGH